MPMYGLDGKTVGYFQNCLNGKAQKVWVSVINSSQRPEKKTKSPRSILGTVLFNIFNDYTLHLQQVCKSGSGLYTRWLCCHSELSGQAGEMD